jgi:hypothetical protein
MEGLSLSDHSAALGLSSRCFVLVEPLFMVRNAAQKTLCRLGKQCRASVAFSSFALPAVKCDRVKVVGERILTQQELPYAVR